MIKSASKLAEEMKFAQEADRLMIEGKINEALEKLAKNPVVNGSKYSITISDINPNLSEAVKNLMQEAGYQVTNIQRGGRYNECDMCITFRIPSQEASTYTKRG